MPTSPLAEVDENSLSEAFNANPEEITDSQLKTIIKELRKMREIWRVSEIKGSTRGPTQRPKLDLDLKDLDL
jgi:hypothetical protein